MLRDVWFWEVEVVRVESSAPAAAPWRLDFSLKPLNYLLGAMLACGAAAGGVMAIRGFDHQGALGRGGPHSWLVWQEDAPQDPLDYAPVRWCSCGRPPERTSAQDSTLLVRRLR